MKYNGYNYDYHFIIKELLEEHEGHFICLGENTDKHITFLVPMAKEITRIGKKEKKSPRPSLTDYNFLIVKDFWQTLYQILLIILLNEFVKSSWNMEMITKNVKLVELNTKYKRECCLEYTKIKDDLIEYKYLFCNKNYQKMFEEISRERERVLPEKEDFYSNLSMEDITDVD